MFSSSAPWLYGGAASAASIVANYVAAAAANGGTVSAGRQTLLTTLIGVSMSSGHWANTDDMALMAAENAGSALTTLKGNILMTAVNAPTFTVDRDYACNGTTQYLRTNWIPASHAQRMAVGEHRLGVYERTNLLHASTSLGCTQGGVSTISMRARSASTTMLTALGTSTGTFTIATDSRGLKVVSRTGNSTTANGWDRGVALTDVTGLTALATALPALIPLTIGARGAGAASADQFRAGSFAFAEWGAPLPGGTASELAWYNALQAFMTAIGANV